MKIMIMTDMEGAAGILNHDDWVMRDGRFFEKGQRLLTEEVNAAVAGFFEGGAKEILVIDGHGQRAIDPELLDERVRLMCNPPQPVNPWGLDKSFDGLAFVGQHAKAGTPYSHITHTGWFNFIDINVNGISIGEYGEVAFCAMELGVPTIFAAGEEALAEEAEKLTPGVVTVGVKRGLLPDGLAHLDTEEYRNAKLSAIHLSPKRARVLICEGARKAIKKLREKPSSFHYPKIKPPYVRTIKLRKNKDIPAHSVRVRRDSLIELMNVTYEENEK